MAETASATKTTRARRSTTASKKTEPSEQTASTEKTTTPARSVLPKVEGHQWTASSTILGGYTLELHPKDGSGRGLIVTVSKADAKAHDALEKAGKELLRIKQFNEEMDAMLADITNLETLTV